MSLVGFDGRVAQAKPALGLPPGSEFQAFSRELRCLHAGGGSVCLALHASFFTEPGAAEPCLIVQAQDVGTRRAAEAGLQHLAFHDALTGVANRRCFLECLDSAVARSRTDPRHAWAVIFIDVDRIKRVNDSLGHHAGDELLQQVARQPLLRLGPDRHEHRPVGFNAPLRWRGADGSAREPGQFLRVAEETGLMRSVTDSMLHCACRQVVQWQRSSPALAELGLRVNRGAHDLRQPDLVARVSRALVESGLKPHHLTLEFTEGSLPDAPALPAAAAHETLLGLVRPGPRTRPGLPPRVAAGAVRRTTGDLTPVGMTRPLQRRAAFITAMPATASAPPTSSEACSGSPSTSAELATPNTGTRLM